MADDEIQQLIDINNRVMANEFLKKFEKQQMLQVVCRMIYKGIEDDAYIAQITSCNVAEIRELRTYLLMEEAMIELGLSENKLRRFIKRGLTIHEGKIPRYAIHIMKYDPKFSFLMQWEYQKNKQENQTKEEYMEEIRSRIKEFEEDFGGTFEELYSHLTDLEIDFLDEAFDVSLWKELVEELQEIEKRGSD